MQTLLRNIGNSKGVVLPAQLLKELGIDVGDKLEVKAFDGKLILEPADKRKKLKLTDLIKKCDLSTPAPKELNDWDYAPSLGVEV